MAPPTVQTLQRLAAETGYRLDAPRHSSTRPGLDLASMRRSGMAPASINPLTGSSSSQRTHSAWKPAAFSRAARSR